MRRYELSEISNKTLDGSTGGGMRSRTLELYKSQILTDVESLWKPSTNDAPTTGGSKGYHLPIRRNSREYCITALH